MAQDIEIAWRYCGVIPILFGWFLTLVPKNLQAGYLWWNINILNFPKQSKWCGNMAICFILRLQFSQWRCPEPIFRIGHRAHANIIFGMGLVMCMFNTYNYRQLYVNWLQVFKWNCPDPIFQRVCRVHKNTVALNSQILCLEIQFRRKWCCSSVIL